MGDLIDEISMGPFGSDVKVEYFTETGIPILNGSNITGFVLNDNNLHFMDEACVRTMKKAVARRGDVIITHRGTLGQVVYVPDNSKYSEYLISQSQFRVRFKSAVLPEYVVYYLHSRGGQAELLSNASQVGVPSLARPTSTFKNLRIPVPELKIQKGIVKVISDIQDKIIINQAINDNLGGACFAA